MDDAWLAFIRWCEGKRLKNVECSIQGAREFVTYY